MKDFVCGISLDNFKHQPTPEELGAIVAKWNSDDQAMFFICMGEGLRNNCGGKHFMQWQYIADSIKSVEDRLCDGSGSQLIEEIAVRTSSHSRPERGAAT
jgi:hypothetical protein